ncbi:MAG: D-serine ammonia-lyase, partial [Rhizobium sp.]|nr:D-serine ammonia-lyase [Rhizobium sp.]
MNQTNLSLASADTLAALRARRPQLWINPGRGVDGEPGGAWGQRAIGMADVEAAANRFKRFAPVLQILFPEAEAVAGVIESPLLRASFLQEALRLRPHAGQVFVKADHVLPIAGSIKARGGIHEVLELAEDLAVTHGLASRDDLTGILSSAAREFFGQYQVAVGSTGNLGLSIGVIASALGFKATVHMSSDAKQWKKERLRKRNVTVVEHEGDYAAAVAAGRLEADSDPKCYFVDDEDSLSLFLGYSAAALALKDQLSSEGVVVDERHPLFVYLPCGVGGAPAGITFGLAHIFGPHVHCFFAEPVASPCFLVSMLDPSGGNPSVYEVGLDNRTEADGLAVPRASARAVTAMRTALSGVFTVEDEVLFRHLHTAATAENLKIEPSAAAAFDGPRWLTSAGAGAAYLEQQNLAKALSGATHILWTTGGLYVPDEEYQAFFARGAGLHRAQ